MTKKDYSRKDSLGYWIYRTHSLGSAALRKAFKKAGFDVTAEQFGLLGAIYDYGGVSQSELGNKTLKDRHNVTRILNLLERRGYVERRTDKTDKTIYRIFLRGAGRKTYEALLPVIASHAERAIAGLSPEDIATTRKVLEHIGRNCKNA